MRNPEKIDRKSSLHVYLSSPSRVLLVVVVFVRSFSDVFQFQKSTQWPFDLLSKCRGHYDSICFILLLPNTKISVSLCPCVPVIQSSSSVARPAEPAKKDWSKHIYTYSGFDTLKINLSIFLQSKQRDTSSRYISWGFRILIRNLDALTLKIVRKHCRIFRQIFNCESIYPRGWHRNSDDFEEKSLKNRHDDW
jgi:hypothetical protein